MFLSNRHGNSVRVVLYVGFEGTEVVYIYCRDVYGDFCGSGYFEVKLDIGDDQELIEEIFECEACTLDDARIQASALYPKAKVLDIELT